MNSPPKSLALTGRIRDWLDNNESRLPVSCTVFNVEDSMSGKDGIENSWLFASHAIRNAAGVAINLSELRPAGTDNGRGLVSSGAASFAKFYSLINQELRRGGVYKNGAVTIFLDYDHPDCEEFLKLAPNELPWAKRALYVDESIKNNPLLPLIAEKVNNGSLWLAKKQYDKQGNRLYSNVCLEVLLPSRGTCLLSHVNLGAIANPKDLPQAFTECAEWLCQLHSQTGIDVTGYYLSPEEDKQVGLGVIGLANFLAIQGVTYVDFVDALDYILSDRVTYPGSDKALNLAYLLKEGYDNAALVGRKYDMDRMFVIAPTASSSYRYKDIQGFTTAPEISAPIDYELDRDSGTFGVQTYEYNPKTEIAKDVGWSVQWRLLNAWQRLMDSTGMGHSISANLWSQQVITPEWITDTFMPSALKTTYYRITVDSEALDKSEVVTPESSEEKLRSLYEEPKACPVIRLPEDDPNYCAACGG